MTDIVKEKLRDIFNNQYANAIQVLKEAEEYFGEDLVDSNIDSLFEDFVKDFSNHTLGEMGITSFQGSNKFGSYKIDPIDYKNNGRGLPFLEYIPDLGILEYLTPVFVKHIKDKNLNLTITIRFPKVTIQNEYGRTHDITELYVRFQVACTGIETGFFLMTRTEFTDVEFNSGYIHSHLPKLYSGVPYFQNPCLGKGPIKSTQEFLQRTYDIERWGLFFYELSKYVQIESIKGVPYIRMSEINNKGTLYCISEINNGFFPQNWIRSFIKDLMREDIIKFCYTSGYYSIADSPSTIVLKISNFFIKWYNKNNLNLSPNTLYSDEMVSGGLLTKGVLANQTLYLPNDKLEKLPKRKEVILNFKGQDIKLKIKHSENTSYITILTPLVISYIIRQILLTINIHYGTEHITKPYYI